MTSSAEEVEGEGGQVNLRVALDHRRNDSNARTVIDIMMMLGTTTLLVIFLNEMISAIMITIHPDMMTPVPVPAGKEAVESTTTNGTKVTVQGKEEGKGGTDTAPATIAIATAIAKTGGVLNILITQPHYILIKTVTPTDDAMCRTTVDGVMRAKSGERRGVEEGGKTGKEDEETDEIILASLRVLLLTLLLVLILVTVLVIGMILIMGIAMKMVEGTTATFLTIPVIVAPAAAGAGRNPTVCAAGRVAISATAAGVTSPAAGSMSIAKHRPRPRPRRPVINTPTELTEQMKGREMAWVEAGQGTWDEAGPGAVVMGMGTGMGPLNSFCPCNPLIASWCGYLPGI